MTTGYALQSAASFASESKGAVIEGRETVRANYLETEKEIAAMVAKRDAIKVARSPAELEAAIKTVLARAVKDGERVRGTVASISAECSKADARTTESCAEVGRLREDLAAATAAARIDQRLGELRGEARKLREQGGASDANAPATLLSRLSLGWLSPADVEAWRSIYLALLVEFVSVFGLLMSLEQRALAEAWNGMGRRAAKTAEDAPRATLAASAALAPRPTRARKSAEGNAIDGPVVDGGTARRLLSGPARDGGGDAMAEDAGDVAAFVFERLSPADGGRLSLAELHRAYVKWCKVAKRRPVAREVFGEWFETTGKAVGLVVEKRGDQVFCDDVQLAA